MKSDFGLEVIACYYFRLRLMRKALSLRRYMQLRFFFFAGSRFRIATSRAFADYAMTTVQDMGSAQQTFMVSYSNYTNIDKAECNLVWNGGAPPDSVGFNADGLTADEPKG